MAVYRSTPSFDETSIPAGLLGVHTTRSGVWGRIVIERGRLLLRLLAPDAEEIVLEPDRPGILPPEHRHQVQPLGPVRFRVEFLR